MRTFLSEWQVDYSTYTFGYTAYCLKESKDALEPIYQQGFLPFTGDLGLDRDVFYLARSLRVDLNKFRDNSENRRVDRLNQPLDIAVDVQVPEALIHDKGFLEFCTRYADERFIDGTMSRERLRYVLTRHLSTQILVYRSSLKQILGYVIAPMSTTLVHYWYAFFDTTYLRPNCLGKWLMWRTIKWAKETNRTHIYLGTCYKTKAQYKFRDHHGIEFFDGTGWNDKVDVLKRLCDRDGSGVVARDIFKDPSSDLAKDIFERVLELTPSPLRAGDTPQGTPEVM